MKTKHWLILILVLAAVLRFYGLSRGDTVNDEVFYGFRAIGPMDFDEAADQKTPWEWFDPSTVRQSSPQASSGQADIPLWTKLSFHDHPPLVFWIQHFSISALGENNFALRFPSAVLGIISVYLLYLIGRRLYSPQVGLIASALMAVTLNSVYISRTGMQEPYVIFFLLLSIYLFLRAQDQENYLIWTGIAIGFGLLAKYNVFILVPIFLTLLLFLRRDYFKSKKLWLGALFAVLIFSPVIIYNLKLYQAVGHFDFQFSHIFRQNPKIWQVAPGKEIGTLYDRLTAFIPRLVATNSWVFLSAFALSFFAGLTAFLKRKKMFLKENALLLIVFFYLFLLLMAIGPSFRFLTILAPFTALAIAIFFGYFHKTLLRKKFQLACALFGAFVLFEAVYAYNNQIAYYPSGPRLLLSSKVRYENYNWGYNRLGEFFKKEFAEKMPAIRFDAKYKFIEKEQDKFLGKAKRRGYQLYPAMIVTYGNFDRGAKLWVLDRLHIYHGWPVIDLETYFKFLEENGYDYYEKVGFKYYYFVLKTNIVPSAEFKLLVSDIEPISIKNPRGDESFKIYPHDLSGF